MEDLVGALSGGMHVSQDRQNLKALHDYLSQTMTFPDLPTKSNPQNPYYAHPTSRSASSSRMPPNHQYHQAQSQSQNSPMAMAPPLASPIGVSGHAGHGQSFHQPYPSPVSTNNAFFHSAEELSTPSCESTHVNMMQRSSSYGFPGTTSHMGMSMTTGSGGASSTSTVPAAASGPIESTSSFDNSGGMDEEPGSPTGFEGDAFAPLWQRSTSRARKDGSGERSNPWAGFIGQSSIFGRRSNSSASAAQAQKEAYEQEMSDAEMVDEAMGMGMDTDMDMDEKMGSSREVVQPVVEVGVGMGLGMEEERKRGLGLGFTGWDRGRRKRQQ